MRARSAQMKTVAFEGKATVSGCAFVHGR